MRQRIRMAMVLVLLLMVRTGQAQVVDKKVLTLEGARQIIAAATAEAHKKHAPGGAIAVVDDGGNLVALERLDNTFTASATIAIGEARTAVTFQQPTRFFEDVIKNGRTAMVALPDFTPLQGGVPITVAGTVVGAVGVSGAASAQQDEELAIAGVSALQAVAANHGADPAAARTTYIASKTVAEGFAKGAVLVDDGEVMMHASRNYMVHASRREAPGMAEIHTLDTDIMYVLEGSATLVTGGTAVDAKTTAPHELRGTAIRDGEVQHLSKGDVVVIPNGVPHWFQEVQGPFLYYVVKVR